MNETTPEEKVSGEEPVSKEPTFTVNDKRHSNEEATPVEVVEEPALDFSKFTPMDVEKLYKEREALTEEVEKKRLRLNELARGVQDLQRELDTRGARMDREQEKQVDNAKGQLLSKLLNVLDSFKLSLDSIPSTEQTQPILQGVHMIYRQFLVELGDLGLQTYSPEGETFDPARHSALRNEVVEDEQKDGRVISVIRPGYRHGSRMLRPAEVIVGKYTAPVTEDTEAGETESDDQAST